MMSPPPSKQQRPTSPARRVYRSLRAVKVLLAALRSTLTVLAPRKEGAYRFALEKQLLFRAIFRVSA